MLYLVDQDGVITMFTPAVCEEHNRLTGENLKPEDIDQWDLRKFGIKDETWQKPGFFASLEPYPGAIEALWDLYQLGHKLWIVTNGMDIPFIEREKAAWVREHIPFIRGIVFTDRKSEVPGDALIDDCPHFLETYPGVTVKINHPYNREVEADYSFDSLMEASKVL